MSDRQRHSNFRTPNKYLGKHRGASGSRHSEKEGNRDRNTDKRNNDRDRTERDRHQTSKDRSNERLNHSRSEKKCNTDRSSSDKKTSHDRSNRDQAEKAKSNKSHGHSDKQYRSHERSHQSGTDRKTDDKSKIEKPKRDTSSASDKKQSDKQYTNKEKSSFESKGLAGRNHQHGGYTTSKETQHQSQSRSRRKSNERKVDSIRPRSSRGSHGKGDLKNTPLVSQNQASSKAHGQEPGREPHDRGRRQAFGRNRGQGSSQRHGQGYGNNGRNRSRRDMTSGKDDHRFWGNERPAAFDRDFGDADYFSGKVGPSLERLQSRENCRQDGERYGPYEEDSIYINQSSMSHEVELDYRKTEHKEHDYDGNDRFYSETEINQVEYPSYESENSRYLERRSHGEYDRPYSHDKRSHYEQSTERYDDDNFEISDPFTNTDDYDKSVPYNDERKNTSNYFHGRYDYASEKNYERHFDADEMEKRYEISGEESDYNRLMYERKHGYEQNTEHHYETNIVEGTEEQNIDAHKFEERRYKNYRQEDGHLERHELAVSDESRMQTKLNPYHNVNLRSIQFNRYPKKRFYSGKFRGQNQRYYKYFSAKQKRVGQFKNNNRVNQSNRNKLKKGIVTFRHTAKETEEKSASNGQDIQQSEIPKRKAVVDRGKSGCVLKEDRPYEDRQSEGFLIHMDPPLNQEIATENQIVSDKNMAQVQQQPVIFIPNQDFQHGAGQNVDQFRSIVHLQNVPDGSKAGIPPLPMQGSDGQEMIFIPFGSNTKLPDNMVPVQQNNFPFGFIPQFVPADQMAQTPMNAIGKFNAEAVSSVKIEDIKTVKRKPLTNEQRAKIRSKLLLRKKEMLVKEVEQKVLENFLDKSKIASSVSKVSEGDNNQLNKQDKDRKAGSSPYTKSRKEIGNEFNIAEGPSSKKSKKEVASVTLYDAVSDLEDVSDEEETDKLSDWENVSVDEIELDANERRPKFRKPNEPRTFIHHSTTKRKLNVRKATAQRFDSDKNGSVTETLTRNEISPYSQSNMQSKRNTSIKERNLSDKKVYRAYTTNRVSEELKRIESENRMTNRDHTRSPVFDSKSNKDQWHSNIRETRQISPLQVTVKNNLYGNKETSYSREESSGNMDRPEDGYDRGRPDNESRKRKSAYDKPPDSNINRHKDTMNAPSNRTDIQSQEVSFNDNTLSDRRIIREMRQRESFGSREDRERGMHLIVTKREEDDRTRKELETYSYVNRSISNEFSYNETNQNDHRERAPLSRDRDIDDNLVNQRTNRLTHNTDSARDDYKSRVRQDIRQDVRPDERHSRDRDGFNHNKSQKYSKNDKAGRTEPYIQDKDRTERRLRQKEKSAYKNDNHRANDKNLESPYKRDDGNRHHADEDDDDFLYGSSERKKGISDEEGDEQNFIDEPVSKNQDTDYDTTVIGTFGMGNATIISQPMNQVDIFDPSLPPIQNVSTISAPSAPGLPDMSLPPPQLIATQFASSPQVVVRNAPLLNQESQVQTIQQPQIIGLQQSQPVQTFQSTQTIQQPTLAFQPQIANQQSFQQQTVSQQPSVGQMGTSIQQQSVNQQLQFQSQGPGQQQQQQRSFQILVDHSQPLTQQLSLNQQQNLTSQQQQQQLMNTNIQQPQSRSAIIQQPQSRSVVSYSSQNQNLNQGVNTASQQAQSQIAVNQSPFQNVQQTLSTLGINQGVGMQGRVVGVNQGQTVIQRQVQGQSQQRGYIVPASFTGSLQGYNKVP